LGFLTFGASTGFAFVLLATLFAGFAATLEVAFTVVFVTVFLTAGLRTRFLAAGEGDLATGAGLASSEEVWFVFSDDMIEKYRS
jgi:hypothetical protein